MATATPGIVSGEVTDLVSLAAHVAVALRLYRRTCREGGRAYPAALAELEELLALAVRVSAQERAPASTDSPADGDGDYGRPMTVTEYATRMRIHPSTVRRWIRTGSLKVERHGRTVRIPKEAP